MKPNFRFKRLLDALVLAVFMLLAGVLVRESFTTAHAAINQNNPLPASWIGTGGTNVFTLNASAVPVVTYLGTNYTAISTNVTGITNKTLRVINGIIVQVY